MQVCNEIILDDDFTNVDNRRERMPRDVLNGIASQLKASDREETAKCVRFNRFDLIIAYVNLNNQ